MDQKDKFGDQSDTRDTSVWCWLQAAISCMEQEAMLLPACQYGSGKISSHASSSDVSTHDKGRCRAAKLDGHSSGSRFEGPKTMMTLALYTHVHGAIGVGQLHMTMSMSVLRVSLSDLLGGKVS